MAACGLDFGTSNSALGIIGKHGPTLAALEGDAELIPTAVFFDLENWSQPRFGQAAVQAAIALDNGRFMRALKSILGSELIDKTTQIGPHRITLSGVIESFIRHLKAKAEQAAGCELDAVVHGRPVHFVDGDGLADARAQTTLEAAARKSGFRHVHFMYEPIAAAYHYEQTATREELVLVADIGGGTSDFSLIRIGPVQRGRPERERDVLASAGRRIGGTDLDTGLSLDAVMPLLGLGGRLIEKDLPIPKAIYFELATWAMIPFAYSWPNMRLVSQLLRGACEPEKLLRLERTLEQRLGHRIAFAVEEGKIALSQGAAARLDLDFLETGLSCVVQRPHFEETIAEKTSNLTRTAAACIAAAGLRPDDIDTIFFTGGSSRVPAIQSAITRAAPAAQRRSGSDLLSVALGLTHAASRLFG